MSRKQQKDAAEKTLKKSKSEFGKQKQSYTFAIRFQREAKDRKALKYRRRKNFKKLTKRL